MKVFVILFAVTIAIHGSSATSADIQNQVNLYVGNAATQIQTSVSNYKAQIGTQANKYYDALNALATRIGNDLKAIGITTIANQINTDVNNLVTNLKNSLNPTSLQTQLQTILTTLSNYQSTVQSYIDQLKAAVDRNSANMVCWNNNAATLKSISDDVLSQTNAAVSNGLVSLNSQIQAIANTINTATTTHENQVKACNGNTACINALVSIHKISTKISKIDYSFQ